MSDSENKYYVSYQETNASSMLIADDEEGGPGPEEGLPVYVAGYTSTVWLAADKQYTPTLQN